MSVDEDLQSVGEPGQADLVRTAPFGQLLDTAIGVVHRLLLVHGVAHPDLAAGLVNDLENLHGVP